MRSVVDQGRPSRRAWVLTLRRFLEIAWSRHALTRYASVTVVPIAIAAVVPGWWWSLCAAGAALGIVIDQVARRAFFRLADSLDQLDEASLQRIVDKHMLVLAALTACYVLPYALLAFAPGPGPLIGVLFCAGGAIVCASLHVMTRTMIFFTIPAPLLGLVLNGYALGEGGVGVLLALLAGTLGFNAITMARAGAASFGDLIDARLKAEEAAEHLERRVVERTQQLAHATQRAQAANKAKSAFLASMSHELRTPLNAVIGYAEIIEEDLAGGDVAQSAADLGRIRKAATHLLTLINEVLDFSRIEAGKLELSMAAVEVAPILREALDTVLPLASKNGTTCRLVVDEGVVAVQADETRLRQCVLNLLSNAAKFTRDGDILLLARGCRLGGEDGVAISVRDTGQGIGADDLAKLFQPFVQADAGKTRHDGAGLGLVITRRLARAMGGDVVARSELGKGSMFTLFLRSAPAAQQAAAA
ncbi:MAG TPA: ATP-binding protein [Vitreimonas sp.]|uniref:sensor histidine kinase n=1 Tax=Vitreimonas sp. TaxID=3069702 RepID=UPI002D313CE1|nr:ATP-binding protein [Vitreimonas sp.]HYD87065.1 ATP-binding protein [Vitreimonas sp.]